MQPVGGSGHPLPSATAYVALFLTRFRTATLLRERGLPSEFSFYSSGGDLTFADKLLWNASLDIDAGKSNRS